jgi:hypothetical protein
LHHASATNAETPKIIVNSIAHLKSTYFEKKAKLERELEFFLNHIYVREVPLGMRFDKRQKQPMKWFKNDINNYCICCGGDVPDVEYVRFGYYAKICVCCLNDLLPEIKKHVDEVPEDIKDLWGKERFLTDLN